MNGTEDTMGQDRASGNGMTERAAKALVKRLTDAIIRGELEIVDDLGKRYLPKNVVIKAEGRSI